MVNFVLACEKMHMALISVRHGFIPALVSKSSTHLIKGSLLDLETPAGINPYSTENNVMCISSCALL